MFDIGGPIGSVLNLLVIVLGFGAIVFVHELGHFLAAKWAGIRVLAFSLGFGQVLVSYRKGVGLVRGSSDQIYREAVQKHPEGACPIGATEYRLSALPLGGYVKMLGQEDLNPNAVSDAPDSYQNCPIPKRLIVISAGVVMNLVTAAALFVVVFMAGLPTIPPVAGQVPPGSPAATAAALTEGIDDGLEPGDRIVSINGTKVRSFRDIATEAAMSRRGGTRIVADRPGRDAPVVLEAELEPGAMGLLSLGVLPPRSTTLITTDQHDLWAERTAQAGLSGIEPGSTLLDAQGDAIGSAQALLNMARETESLTLRVRAPSGEERAITIETEPALMERRFTIEDAAGTIEHIQGLTGVMMVDPDSPAGITEQGLEPGDVFVRLGGAPYPSITQGIRVIRAHTGGPLDLVVRRGAGPDAEDVPLTVRVREDGRIGFLPSTTTRRSTLIGTPMPGSPAEQWAVPGERIERVAGRPVNSIAHAAEVMSENARPDNTDPISIDLIGPGGEHRAAAWDLGASDREDLASLGRRWPGGELVQSLMLPEMVVDREPNPIAAIERGLHESRRVMLQTYLTFLRLFQGTVKVEHLKGPVGIAHIGTMIAEEGLVKVLFFLGLISINLAVINFLPLPIVDGGQFLMLCYEWIRGRPIPIPVQNAVTIMGLVFIGSVFLLVTFNDIRALIGV